MASGARDRAANPVRRYASRTGRFGLAEETPVFALLLVGLATTVHAEAPPAPQRSGAPSAESSVGAPPATPTSAGAPAAGSDAPRGPNAEGARSFGRGGAGGGDMGARQRRGGAGRGETSSNDVWYLAAALGAAALLVVLRFWFRASPRDVRLPDGVVKVSEAGILGAGTPDLTRGVSQWVVGAEERAALLDDLVAAVAARRPVLVHAPAGRTLRPIVGGPVYRTDLPRAETFHDAVYDLQDAHPALVVVIDLPAGEDLAAWSRDIGTDYPVLALVDAPLEGAHPVVQGAREAGAWRFHTAVPAPDATG